MKKYLIIGKPVSHSLSPILHNYWFKKYNIQSHYTFKEIEEHQIRDCLEDVRRKFVAGINVTLPYKQKVIPFLDDLVNDAKATKSVNTIYLDKNNKLVGDNTDVYGLQAAYLKEILNDKKKISALIIGAGGVSPSIIYALIKSGVSNIHITNRTYEKSLFLKNNFKNIQTIKWENYNDNIKNYDLIINATSLGLKNGEHFTSFFSSYKKTLIYIDTIYNPLETKMIGHLKKNNIKTFNGLNMLVYQGQKSFYLWNKVNPEIDNSLIELLEANIK